MSAAIENIAYFAAMLAVNLAVMNMLHIPALDGGKIFFLAIDTISMKIFRQADSRRYESGGQHGGFVVLMGFMLIVTFHGCIKAVPIGGGLTYKAAAGGQRFGGRRAPVSIQSMCNTKTDDVAATVAQITPWRRPAVEIIRVAIPDQAAAEAEDKIKEQISIPLIADIHFNYRYALMCAERGIDAIRINPGNIGAAEKRESCGGHLPPEGNSLRIVCQWGLPGKGAAGQVRRRHSPGSGESAMWPCGIAEPV